VLALLKLRAQIDATAKDPNKLAEMRHRRTNWNCCPRSRWRRCWCRDVTDVADYLMRSGDMETAQSDCQRALELLRGLATATETPDVVLAVETARTWQLQAQLYFRAQRYTDAMSAWRSARAALDSVKEGRQDNERVTKAVAALEYDLAEAYGTLGAFGGAREHFDLGLRRPLRYQRRIRTLRSSTRRSWPTSMTRRLVGGWSTGCKRRAERLNGPPLQSASPRSQTHQVATPSLRWRSLCSQIRRMPGSRWVWDWRTCVAVHRPSQWTRSVSPQSPFGSRTLPHGAGVSRAG